MGGGGDRMGWLGDDRYYAALEAETAGFAEAVHDADPARPVPTCPAWTLAQLTEHVGQAGGRARRLGQAVREVGPQTEVWSWSQDHTAGFWLRRTTHDTLVHRVDAELAVGREAAADVTVRGRAADLLAVLARRAAP